MTFALLFGRNVIGISSILFDFCFFVQLNANCQTMTKRASHKKSAGSLKNALKYISKYSDQSARGYLIVFEDNAGLHYSGIRVVYGIFEYILKWKG